MSALGFALLAKLGLRDDEADALKNTAIAKEAIYVRDESGIGYTEIPSNFMEASENAFAKLARAQVMRIYDSDDDDEKEQVKLQVKPAQQRRFIPQRLRKKSIGSLSNEDLAHILATDQPVSGTMETVKTIEEETARVEAAPQTVAEEEKPRRRRRRHRHHHEGEEQPAPVETVV